MKQAVQKHSSRVVEPDSVPIDGVQTVYQAAIDYRRLKFSVIPIARGKKHPRIKWREFQDRLPDEDQIRDWFQGTDYGVGIVTGQISKCFVLDIDAYKPKADESLAKLEAEQGPLPETVESLTGGGGRQLFFNHPGRRIKSSVGQNNTLGPGLDVRGDGGLVVLPPSIHPSGKPYRWAEGRSPFDIDPADAPQWLLDLVFEQDLVTSNQSSSSTSNIRPAYANKALSEEVASVRNAPVGSRNDALNKASFSLGQLVGAGALERDAVESALTEAGLAIGLPLPEIKRTINSGLKSGAENPRKKAVHGQYKQSPSNMTTGDDKKDLYSHAIQILKRGHFKSHDAKTVLIPDSKPVDEGWIGSEIDRIYADNTAERRSLAEEVKGHVLSSPGEFMSSQIATEMGLSSGVDKKNLSKILSRLVREGHLQRIGKRRGCFRLVDRSEEIIDWFNAASGGELDITLPLNLAQDFEVMPGSVIVVAGASNAGKTAFCLNVVRMNQGRFNTYYFGSSAESNDRTLRKRIDQFGYLPETWKFEAIRRSQGNFADVIRPDGLNVIDYLEIHDEFYLVGEQIAAIHEKLDNGLAVIALQKEPGKDFGRGGSFTVDKATAYISLDHDSDTKKLKARIVKAKYPLGNKDCNGKVIPYQLIDGCRFIPLKRSGKLDP